MSKESKYVIIRRSHDESSDSDEYKIVGDASSVHKASEFALEFSGNPGDIFIVIDSAHVTNIPRFSEALFCVNSKGKCVKVVDNNLSVTKYLIWEEPIGLGPQGMIGMIEAHWMKPDFRLLNKMSISLAKYCLRGVRYGNYMSATAITKAEEYISGLSDEDSARIASFNALGTFNDNAEEAIHRFCLFVLDVPEFGYTGKLELLQDAIYYAANSRNTNTQDLSDIIRSHVPLREFLRIVADSKSGIY